VTNAKFIGISGSNQDNCTNLADPTFNVAGINTRRVEPRNTPTAINAVFNFRNFLDGRANNNFNGVNPFGQRDVGAKVWKKNAGGGVDAVSVVIPHSSLASQAVGPPLSFFEMSCNGRVWPMVGKRLLNSTVIPLGLQVVHKQDSRLGTISNQTLAVPANGIKKKYVDMVKLAFQPAWWSSTQKVSLPNGTGSNSQFSQMEANFSLFFGLAVQAYERTLVANDTPVDKFLDGTGTLTSQQQLGMVMFQTKGKCLNCHGGAELTNASVVNVENERIEPMIMGNGGCRVYDNGFYNIGSRPTDDDIAVGGKDPFGNPLSESGMSKLGELPEVPFPVVPGCDEINVMGAFKAPGLRNAELTGPYFHNGGKGTLWQVVDFYDRGGDFANDNLPDLDPDIGPIGFTTNEKNGLLAFLLGLTDERVRWERAPFDHPSLCFASGHQGNEVSVVESSPGSGKARDNIATPCLSAIGKNGAPSPLVPFLNLNPFLEEDPAP
jgi:cytochrome c peroxidase